MQFNKDQDDTSQSDGIKSIRKNSDRIKLGNCRICQDKSSGIIIYSIF
jgi:hypothetical protein